MAVMASIRVTLLAIVGSLVVTSAAQAATVKNGSPNLGDYRGTPVAVVFFHPL